MKMLPLVLLFLFLSSRDWISGYEIGDCGIRNSDSKDNEFPWHVALYKMDNTSKYTYLCGGTIIDNDVVLAAAHCVYDEAKKDIDNSTMVVAAGKHNSSWESRDVHEQRFEVIAKIVPFSYRGVASRYQDDIALLSLNESIKFSSAVMPVCYDRGGRFQPSGEIGTIVGWGANKSYVVSDELQLYRVQPISFGECLNNVRKGYTQYLTSDKFCAVHKDDVLVKPGVDGGGLVFTRNLDANETSTRYFLQGILSGREKEGNNYALFTNITNHIPWINIILSTIRTKTNASKVSSGDDRINPKELGECGIRYNKVVPSITHKEFSIYNEFPWHVALYKMDSTNKYEYMCGGSIIDTNVVITAANCVYDEAKEDLDNSTMVVAAGKHNVSWEHRDEHEQRFEVISSRVPYTYKGVQTRYQDDIALLALNGSIKFSSTVMPVCYDRGGMFEPSEEIGTLVGWSPNENGVLRELHVYSMQQRNFGECLNMLSKGYRSFLTSDKFCAVNKDESWVKHGDGGGGLVFTRNLDANETSPRYFIKGILSSRDSDAKKHVLFTNITSHIPWINSNLKTISAEAKKDR